MTARKLIIGWPKKKKILQLNDSNTEVVLFGPSNSIGGIANHAGPLVPNFHAYARNLDVIFDPALKFYKQINTVVKHCQILPN